MEGWEAGTQTELRKNNSCSKYEDNAKGSPGLLSQIFHGLLPLTCFVHHQLIIIIPPSTRALLGENWRRSLYARLQVAPLLLGLSNMTIKKPLGKKWQTKNPRVEKHSFHVLHAPRMSCDHLFFFFLSFFFFFFCKVSFRVMHKELGERGTTLVYF